MPCTSPNPKHSGEYSKYFLWFIVLEICLGIGYFLLNSLQYKLNPIAWTKYKILAMITKKPPEI